MRLLALETATADCSVALALGGQILQAEAATTADKPSEQLPGLVRRVLAESGVGVSQLDAIVFDCGPGAFTGIRVGCGLAQGMALGADLPLIGLCSLRVLAMRAAPGKVLATLDARMGEVYWAVFHREGEGEAAVAQQLADAQVGAPASLRCPQGIDLAIGDGLAAGLASRLPRQIGVSGVDARPRAVDMLLPAISDLRAGLCIPPDSVCPVYIRDKVALTTAEQAARRAPR
jgi:tRNA threonylcarbamoyladenosine biosynthesis protein TsaB